MEPQADKQQVIVVDVNMPFWSMVGFMVKWAVAAIPAFIILFIIGVVGAAIFAGIGTGIHK